MREEQNTWVNSRYLSDTFWGKNGVNYSFSFYYIDYNFFFFANILQIKA